MKPSVGNLSLTEKVGQLFLIGIDGTVANEDVVELIQTYKVGGIILQKKNVESVKQLLALINELKDMNIANQIPLFISIEQEGGRSNVLPNELIQLPSIKYIADKGSKNLVYESSVIVAKVLKLFGINLNFAPVLDLGGYNDGLSLGDRCISNNPVLASSYGAQIIKAMNEQQIISIPKYFPGHDSCKKASSNKIIIPSTSKSIAKLEERDLVPFKAAIDNKVDGIMIGNINMSRLNLFAPATTSYKVVTKLLKQKYEYEGITITDDLCTTSVDIQYGIKDSVKRAIVAGNDIVMIKEQSKVKSVMDYILKQVRSGNVDEKELDRRVEKIIDLKDKYEINNNEVLEYDIEKVNDELQNVLNDIKNS